MRFVLGFTVFIAVFFGVTFVVQRAGEQQDRAEQAAAAQALMFKSGK